MFDDGVDHEAHRDSIKALTVIFIILISLASICLLIKIVSMRHGVFSVQRLMVAVMALASLLYALFSLVVAAIQIFSTYGDAGVSCQNLVTASVYSTYFLPFVYMAGLIMLGIELSRGRPNTHPSVLVRFIYIAIPWLVGLVVVLPLTMAGIDWANHCRADFTIARVRAQVWICLLLPSLLMLFVCLGVGQHIIRQGSGTANSDEASPALSPSAPTYNNQASSYPGGLVLASPQQQMHEQQMMTGQYQANDHHANSLPPQYHTIVPNPQMYQYHSQGQPMYNAPPPNYPPPPNYAPPPPGFGTPYYTVSNSAPPPPPSIPPPVTSTTTTTTRRNRVQEAYTLITISIIFFIPTAFHSIYLISYSLNEDAARLDLLVGIILNDIVYWLTVLRWFVVAVCCFKLVD